MKVAGYLEFEDRQVVRIASVWYYCREIKDKYHFLEGKKQLEEIEKVLR